MTTGDDRGGDKEAESFFGSFGPGQVVADAFSPKHDCR
jgi:hypothetical protein